MRVDVKPWKYVLAVSGGVDSMVLLHLLVQKQSSVVSRQSSAKGANYKLSTTNYQLTVAHFDHGIRSDSAQDRKLVQKTAEQYGLSFVYENGELGPNASEDTARKARYGFLKRVQKEQEARAIVTAHHRDDMFETAIINMLRGTGRKGLSSLSSGGDLMRPLLRWTKADILTYAQEHKILWREDTTNADERYMRNYVRRRILPRFSPKDKQALLERITSSRQINKAIDGLLARDISLHGGKNTLNRPWFIGLPYVLSCEILATWLRQNNISGFDRPLIERLVVAAKIQRPGKTADVNAEYAIKIDKDEIKLFKR